MKKSNMTFLLLSLSFLMISLSDCKKDDENITSIRDIDGNVYTSIQIGTQTWMLENLKVTKYRNGDPIPHVTDNSWYNLTSGAYCNLNHDENYANIYGRLYNWRAVNDSRNIAPKGWHVPSNEEWGILIDFLGGEDVAGGKMKEADTLHWQSPNTGANNESGFNGLPGHDWSGGSIHPEDFGKIGCWWSSTEGDPDYSSYGMFLNYNTTIADRGEAIIPAGFSVRCIKD